MEKLAYDAYILYAVVLVFGILGNILVVISILRQKNVLKSNYYFLVLQLAICDLGALIILLLDAINRHFGVKNHILISTNSIVLAFL